MKNYETEPKNKLLEVIPTDKLYTIHNDLRKYHNKWDADQVMELADTSSIENFYNAVQYLNRVVPVVGAALVAQGYTEAGIVTTGISLYADYLITTGKEKIFKASEKQAKLTEFTKDLDNIYDKHQELSEILAPLRDSHDEVELTKLLQLLKNQLSEIEKRDEVNHERIIDKWERRLSYIFWSLRKDKSSNIKELMLLNNGIKALSSWNELPLSTKTWSELSRLFISLREEDPLWMKWEKAWESRRNEHRHIKKLIKILQTAISEYKQGIAKEEIESEIKNRLLKLETVQIFQELAPLITNASREIRRAIVDLREKISKLNSDKSLSLDIANAEGQLLTKEVIKQFIEDLQIIQIDWDDKTEKAIINLRSEVDKHCKELKKTENQIANHSSLPLNGKEKELVKNYTSEAKDYLTTPYRYWESWSNKKEPETITDNSSETNKLVTKNENQQSEIQLLEFISTTDDLTNISQEFSNQNLVKQWTKKNFTLAQTQSWIEIGLTVNDVEFATWLRDIKSQDIEDFNDPQWIKKQITTKRLELSELRKEFVNASAVTLAEVKDNEQHAVIEVVPTPSSSKQ